MAQPYADRVAARPAYATYKNRKKEVRRQERAGRIAPERRRLLPAIARNAYNLDR